jgi:hypothetical protein
VATAIGRLRVRSECVGFWRDLGQGRHFAGWVQWAVAVVSSVGLQVEYRAIWRLEITSRISEKKIYFFQQIDNKPLCVQGHGLHARVISTALPLRLQFFRVVTPSDNVIDSRRFEGTHRLDLLRV